MKTITYAGAERRPASWKPPPGHALYKVGLLGLDNPASVAATTPEMAAMLYVKWSGRYEADVIVSGPDGATRKFYARGDATASPTPIT